MVERDYDNAYRAHISRWGVGATLRGAREAGGETIAEAATATRLRAEYILALENEDYQLLPGWAHALSYVRTYAEYLGLDASPLVKRVREQIELRQHLMQNPPAGERGHGRWRVAAAVALAVAASASAGWYFANPAVSLAAVFDPVPRGLKALIDRTFVTVAEDTGEAAGGGPDSIEDVLAVNVEIESAEPVRELAAETALAAPAPASAAPSSAPAALDRGAAPIAASTAARFAPLRDPPDEPEAADPSGRVVIATHPRDTVDRAAVPVSDVILRAKGPVWLTVEDASGRSLLAQKIAEGELYRLPVGSGFTVTTDDAGALEVYVEGALAGVVGPSGARVTRLPVERLAAHRADG